MASQHTPHLAVHTGVGVMNSTRQSSLQPTPPFFCFDFFLRKYDSQFWITLGSPGDLWKWQCPSHTLDIYIWTSGGAFTPFTFPCPTHKALTHVQLRLRTTASRSHINKEKAELLGMEKRSFLKGNYKLPTCFISLIQYFLFRPSLNTALKIHCSLGTAQQFPFTSGPQHHLRKQWSDWKTKG